VSTSKGERSRRRCPFPAARARVRLTTSDGQLRIDAVAGRVNASAHRDLARTVAQMFRLDEDLSGFYAVVSQEGDLSWCARGAGRMLRAPTVFEDVVKTT
jgi:3-methyladenine DNA glycosylase/8-oxoguanine DNA glycosylase